MMSAMSNLAGLYPPKGNQVWNPDILWQPIPVHTRPLAEDNLLSSHARCPKFENLLKELMESQEIQGMQKYLGGWCKGLLHYATIIFRFPPPGRDT